MHSASFTNSTKLICVFSPLTRTLGAGLVFAQETTKKKPLLAFTMPNYINVLLDISLSCHRFWNP